MASHATFDPLHPLDNEAMGQLFATIACWSDERWRLALRTARDQQFRVRRATARLFCDVRLEQAIGPFGCWAIRDLARTAALAAPVADRAWAAQLLEDAAGALLARPELELRDLAVLLQPCLPLLG